MINPSIFYIKKRLVFLQERERDCKGMNIKITPLSYRFPYKDAFVSQFGGHVLADGHVNTCLPFAVSATVFRC